MKKFVSVKTLIFVLLVIFTTQHLRSQVICTDVNPDLTVTGNATTDIDLNNDLSPDFRITSAQAGILSFVIVQAGQIATTNSVLANGANGALALPAGSPIGSGSSTWIQMNGLNQTMIQVANSVATGLWAGVSDQYLGLSFVVGLNTYYGWARFSFSNNSNTFIFKDYAYNSVPGQQILAGQGCASITSPAMLINGNLCAGNSLTLTANTGTAIASTYNWVAVPAGAAFTAATSSITALSFSAAGTYTVLLVVTSGTVIGMAQNTLAISGFTPTINSNSPLCTAQQLTLSATGGTAYTWNLPGGTTTTAPSVTVASPVNGLYTVTATSAAGCTASATSSITINPLPTISVSPNSYTTCLNASTVNIQATGSSAQYSWSPAQGLSTTTTQAVSASPSVSTVYTVTGSLNNCTASATSTVYVFLQPFMTASGATLCLGQQAILTATLTPPAVNYAWSAPTGAQLIVNNPTINVSFNNVGVYTVTAYSAIQACQATATVMLVALPNPIFTVAPLSANICSGGTGVLLSTAGTATLYSWSPAPGLSGTSGSTVTANPSVTTVYTATGSLNNCTATAAATILVSVCMGLNDTDPENRFLLYPNPAADRLYLETKQSTDATIEIIDAAGKIILKQHLPFQAGQTESISISQLPPGLYLVKISAPDGKPQLSKILK